MYGSIAALDDSANQATEPLLAVPAEDKDNNSNNNPCSLSSPAPPAMHVDHSRSQKLRRQKTKRKLKEMQKEQPVLRSIFFDADKRKVKEQIKQQQHRRSSSRIISATATTAISHKKKKKHSFIYSMLSPYSNKWQSRIFKRFIAIVIVTDLILFILSTETPNDISSPQSFYLTRQFFHVTEGIVSSIFLVEYLARLYCITESTKYATASQNSRSSPLWMRGSIRARWAYMTTWPALVDLMATLPFFLELAITPGHGGHNVDVLPRLTYLRCFRLFRILKTDSYIIAMDAVYRVVYYNREILTVAMLVCFLLVLITSVLLYICRPPATSDNNIKNFDSIGDTLYISTLMLTGQGGPDGENLPWYTKAVVLLTSVFSVAMFAIPASMLTWGFEAEAERMAKRARKRALQEKKNKSTTTRLKEQAAAVSTTRNTTSITTDGTRANGTTAAGDDEWPSTSSSSSSSSAWTASDSDGDTTDEEYFKLIAGEDDDESDDEEEEPLWRKQIRADFSMADSDMDGTLTIKEFLRMQVAARHHQQKEEEQQEKDNALQRQQQVPPQQAPASSAAAAAAAAGNNDTLISQRLEALERQTAENAQKLDQILAILENKKNSSSSK
jgi:voltage-gated potassium channel